MDTLSQKFLDSCRQEDGKVLRGESMTRIETFVDAAFAFSFTMLVISIDVIPQNPQELLELSRDIPAFLLSATIIGSIWLAHSNWSRIFGLQDKLTVALSLALVMLVLIFVYPIKLMVQATVIYLSDGALGTDIFSSGGWDNNEVVSLFVYFGLGLLALSLLIISFYVNSLRYRRELCLSNYKVFYCNRAIYTWLTLSVTSVISGFIALNSDADNVARSGNAYTTLFFTIPLVRHFYGRNNSHNKPDT
ncbi:MAG: DUF1211 domain-containing protein [Gammaproteobacteria bacterium]|jgi:uncharacterized membrane protein|nr:DUF1211 domain-containing protein [Gammaproteobacteria bacterium]MBT3859136.1 DUF1211 domain-containing protein [Gammaproteobacteria bacterium]MBT3987136.1 DUF1211 domain-containing protein [Gammaproteobacteria bacterium]MBT4254872.1 DUF1211 domain-containing protein [Gammaproteobacteria bacterium]MBT4580555.1 DUF1211 domain-containing protein [Gammaproteobacteria bacterium]